ncbi:MAG: SAM-dependent chlorinase/fluorinase [Dehalogenimonas sp.]|uniref:SAM-dependent chlorinase/fluorinase n=1 Tax=Candidatus Dehalogenimonas loeffleri TaxID=3127115 RepID=A0ABZ2J8G3_9CHLR|nr:SAM-dependent chlorinase/fluorinase [Dehalogenimonas sp.]
MNSVITLTTDFGTTDAYVGAVKGVILGINPAAQIVDISHQIQPQNIHQAAFILSRAFPYFPHSAVHLVVVDPGVGSNRRIIILRTPVGTFIGPDNGVLSYAARGYILQETGSAARGPQLATLTGEARAVAVTNSHFFRQPVSDTFHARDIMAPVAALLSQGFQINAFGETIDRLQMLPLSRPASDGAVVQGHVIHIDSFGNIITDVRCEDLLPGSNDLRLELHGHLISGLAQNYADTNGLLALFGSSGYLEIALKNGSAAAITSVRIGDEIKIRAGAS